MLARFVRRAPGVACIWDNRRFVHSTTPVSIYEPGEREMWQIIHRTEREGGGGLDDYLSAIYDTDSSSDGSDGSESAAEAAAGADAAANAKL